MSLDIDTIVKGYGRTPALRGVTLFCEPGEFLALLGPSGSGKTTLLRVIAGLEQADSGAVRFNDEDLLTRPVRERGIGFVFQHYALFRHMNAAQNIAFGLTARPRGQRPPAAEVRRRVEELLALVQLEGLGGRFPAQLSGGQRQRVALARALAIEPRLLLLDEPFGALDAKVRRELRRWLRSLHERTGLTTIFVTHDQEEALELADRVAVLKDGLLEQVGTPEEVYHEPASAFVFDFLGDSITMECEVRAGLPHIGGAPSSLLSDVPPDGRYTAYARPGAFEIGPAGAPGLAAQLRNVLGAGPSARLDCLLEGGRVIEVLAPLEVAANLAPRQRISLSPKAVRIWP